LHRRASAETDNRAGNAGGDTCTGDRHDADNTAIACAVSATVSSSADISVAATNNDSATAAASATCF